MKCLRGRWTENAQAAPASGQVAARTATNAMMAVILAACFE